jgi:hypothetical protein
MATDDDITDHVIQQVTKAEIIKPEHDQSPMPFGKAE